MEMKKNISFTILFVLSFLTTESELFSQDKTLISPYIQLQYFKNTGDQRILKTTLTYSKNRMELPLSGMEDNFYTGGSKKELLGTVITDDKGVSKLELSKDKKIDTDNAGMWAFSTEFKGNDTIEAGSSEISVKDVILEVSYSEADSIKDHNSKSIIL